MQDLKMLTMKSRMMMPLAKKCQQPLDVERGKEQIFLLSFQKEYSP
jgi:hypothetical protein